MSSSFYVAGDWVESFSENYGFIGSKKVARLLNGFMVKGFRGRKIVTAGRALSEKYKEYCLAAHPYMSTTHHSVTKDAANDLHEICYLGRLEPLKRVCDAILAVDVVLRKGYSVKLYICGDGKDRLKLHELVKEKGLKGHVVFMGQLAERADVESVLSNSGVVILPSISEGTPKVLAEGMSFGCIPIAIQDVGSINDIITHEENGLLADPRSPESLAENIVKIIQDPVLASGLRKRALRYAEEHTIQHEVKKLWDFVRANED